MPEKKKKETKDKPQKSKEEKRNGKEKPIITGPVFRSVNDALCFSPNHSSTLRNLREKTGLSIDDSLTVIGYQLHENIIVQRHNKFHLSYDDVNEPLGRKKRVSWEIINSSNPLTTGELANSIKVESGKISNICIYFEKKGYLYRRKDRVQKVFFAPITGERLHAGNHERITEINNSLKSIIIEHEPDNKMLDPKLRKSLKKAIIPVVEQLYDNEEFAGYEREIKEFLDSMIHVIRTAGKTTEVKQLLGFRVWQQPINSWRIK